MRNLAFCQTAYHTSSLADLRKLSADQILNGAITKTTPLRPRFNISVDGYFLPDSVPNIYAAGHQAHVPLLAGWNADESRGQILLDKTPTTVDTFAAMAHTQFGDRASDFLAVYPASTDAEATQSAGDFASDKSIAFSTWRWLESQVATGQFSRPSLPARPRVTRRQKPCRHSRRISLRRHRIRLRHTRLTSRSNLALGRSKTLRPDRDPLLDRLRTHRRPQRHRPSGLANL